MSFCVDASRRLETVPAVLDTAAVHVFRCDQTYVALFLLKTLHDSGQLSSFLFQVLVSLKRFPTGSEPLRFAVPVIVMGTVCPLHDECARQVTSRVPRHADDGLYMYSSSSSDPLLPNVQRQCLRTSFSSEQLLDCFLEHKSFALARVHTWSCLGHGVYASTIPMFCANINCDKRSRG